MGKTLKIIGIIAVTTIIIGGIILFAASGKMKKSKLAQQNSDNIIEKLDSENVLNEFPDKNFPDKTKLRNMINGISKNCNWKQRDGKFVDIFTMKNIGGTDQTAYIYEYYLKCDSLRFILTYNMDNEKPELIRFDMQPLEEPNDMIVFPDKQLKNRN